MPDRRPNPPSQDYLVRLGLPSNCTAEQVREAYLQQARNAHPDHGGDKSAFQLLKSDYEQALLYTQRIHHPVPGKPHDATIRVPETARRASHARIPSGLLVATCISLASCFLLPAEPYLAISLGTLAMLTLMLVKVGLPSLPRPHSTILGITLIGGTGLLMLGLGLQQLYQEVSQIPAGERSAYDWLILVSPAYFLLLWIVTGHSWTRAIRRH